MKTVRSIRRRLTRGRSTKWRRDHKMEVLNTMPKNSVCAEVGVWKGDLSAEILGVVRPKKLHLIDPWMFVNDERFADAWYGGAVSRDQRDMDLIYEGVTQRFSTEIEQGTVEVHRRASADSTHLFADEYFDWVYIDGNHLYEAVKEDLEGFLPKLKKGGLLAGDDYTSGGWWDGGVKRAVDEFIRHPYVDVVFLEGAQFVLRKV
ncbi:MAG: class I SAM-dependent methyltransferase [Actinomycetota bacterium]